MVCENQDFRTISFIHYRSLPRWEAENRKDFLILSCHSLQSCRDGTIWYSAGLERKDFGLCQQIRFPKGFPGSNPGRGVFMNY